MDMARYGFVSGCPIPGAASYVPNEPHHQGLLNGGVEVFFSSEYYRMTM
jgi:hypothetical protein